MISVLLADDQSLVRSGLRMLIDSADDMTTVGEVDNGRDAVAAVRTRHIDVVLMDIRMPVMDGIEATRQITALGVDTKVLVLTTFDLDEYVFAAIRNGASGRCSSRWRTAPTTPRSRSASTWPRGPSRRMWGGC